MVIATRISILYDTLKKCLRITLQNLVYNFKIYLNYLKLWQIKGSVHALTK